MFKHRLFKTIFPDDVTTPYPYANYIVKDIKRIGSNLGKYIAIHWRMESAKAENFPFCANDLIKRLKKIKENYNIDHIYLATDYPLQGKKSQSSSFRNLTHYHHDAISKLKSEFIILDYISLDILKDMRNNPKYAEEFQGAGINGIIDKLMCIHSTVFFHGTESCARKSSFTERIINERENMLNFTFDLDNFTY